jgi:hypothetical protein
MNVSAVVIATTAFILFPPSFQARANGAAGLLFQSNQANDWFSFRSNGGLHSSSGDGVNKRWDCWEETNDYLVNPEQCWITQRMKARIDYRLEHLAIKPIGSLVSDVSIAPSNPAIR